MTGEREKTIIALQTAIRMEIDGREFYLKASRESKNEAGRILLESLSAEEAHHLQKFEKIYAAIGQKKGWPRTELSHESGQKLKTIFSQAIGETVTLKESLQSEIDTVQKAMDMESESRDFYLRQKETSQHVAEKQFYDAVAGEEKAHFLVLLDYFEYLKDPAGWFVEKEHPSLDGG